MDRVLELAEKISDLFFVLTVFGANFVNEVLVVATQVHRVAIELRPGRAQSLTGFLRLLLPVLVASAHNGLTVSLAIDVLLK